MKMIIFDQRYNQLGTIDQWEGFTDPKEAIANTRFMYAIYPWNTEDQTWDEPTYYTNSLKYKSTYYNLPTNDVADGSSWWRMGNDNSHSAFYFEYEDSGSTYHVAFIDDGRVYMVERSDMNGSPFRRYK